MRKRGHKADGSEEKKIHIGIRGEGIIWKIAELKINVHEDNVVMNWNGASVLEVVETLCFNEYTLKQKYEV